MVITKVGVLSVAKVGAVLYAGIGLVIGALFSLIGMAGFGAWPGDGGAFVGMFFGVGAIVILPIFYGVLGFVFTLIAAALFNVAAGLTGGIEIETR